MASHVRTIHAAALYLGVPFCGVRDAQRRLSVGANEHHWVTCRTCRRIISAKPKALSKRQVLFPAALRQTGGPGGGLGVAHGSIGVRIALPLARLGLVDIEGGPAASATIRLLPAGVTYLAQLEVKS